MDTILRTSGAERAGLCRAGLSQIRIRTRLAGRNKFSIGNRPDFGGSRDENTSDFEGPASDRPAADSRLTNSSLDLIEQTVPFLHLQKGPDNIN
jgi:hypothetical protein